MNQKIPFVQWTYLEDISNYTNECVSFVCQTSEMKCFYLHIIK